MNAFAAPDRYQELRAELREVLAEVRRWNELPRLMDRLDRARRDDDAGLPGRAAATYRAGAPTGWQAARH